MQVESFTYKSFRIGAFIGLIIFFQGCKNDPSGPESEPSTGSLEVVVSTSGKDKDVDGYSLSLDGENSQDADIVDTIYFKDVEEGMHSIELSGVQGNCFINGDKKRSVTIFAGKSFLEDFDIACKQRIKNKIVFSSTRDGDADLFLINTDGSTVTKLTNNNDFNDETPSISPDGTRIAYIQGVGAPFENYQTHLMDADGSNKMVLTNKSGGAFYPDWSPDGNKILFTSIENTTQRDIYIIDDDGSRQVRLTQSDSVDDYARWSPNGSKIVFRSDRDGDSEIFITDPEGSEFINLTNNSVVDLDPSWSPDGNKIVFSSDIDGYLNIYTMNSDGSELLKLTNINSGQFSSNRYPSWSPDGKEIVFAGYRDGDYDIYKIKADGSGEQVKLTDSPEFDRFPIWSPVE